VTEEVYVRRRRWSAAEKQRIVSEAETSGNVIATAKRYRIQAQQIYRWREQVGDGASGFIPIAVTSSVSVISDPAPVLDCEGASQDPALVLDLVKRLEITLRSGHRVSLEGDFDLAAILSLARGLEALR
jgi:transposase-like protein